MTKEERWLEKRVGRITASELGDIMSASGRIIDTNLTYIRAKRFEREHGYTLPVTARAMELGNENESMIFEWIKANIVEDGVKVLYSKDLPEIPLWVPDDTRCFGASPDAFTEDETVVYEFKTLVGNESTFFFMDKHTSHEEKMARVFKEHGPQILGLFLSNPKVRSVVLVKYAFQRDAVMRDTDSPLAPWRGVVFVFNRDSFVKSIAETRARVLLFNEMIDSPFNPSEYKEGVWTILNGKLVHGEK